MSAHFQFCCIVWMKGSLLSRRTVLIFISRGLWDPYFMVSTLALLKNAFSAVESVHVVMSRTFFSYQTCKHRQIDRFKRPACSCGSQFHFYGLLRPTLYAKHAGVAEKHVSHGRITPSTQVEHTKTVGTVTDSVSDRATERASQTVYKYNRKHNRQDRERETH